jgi:hypothetical protein
VTLPFPAALAELPFLPPGRGALILILGGLMVLPVSLLLSRPGARPAQAGEGRSFLSVPPASRSPASPYASFADLSTSATADPSSATEEWPIPWQPVDSPGPGGRPWAGTGLERAIRKAVGWTQLLSVEPGHYVVRLGRCDSCLRHTPGCERERAALEGAVRPYLLEARVAERSCAQRDRRAQPCTFDIRGR